MNANDSGAPAARDEYLVNDPAFPWEGGRPYDIVNARLREKGQPVLSPDSSRDDVNKAGFGLGAMTPALRKTYDQLRKPPERALLDFLHYPLPRLRIDAIDPAALELPMPVAEPDLMALADCPVALDEIPQGPDELPAHDVPLSGVIDFGLADLLPAPLCAAPPTLSDLIEVEDDKQ